MIAKAHALDDLAVADVEAGNYAAGKNGASSSSRDPTLEQGLAADRGGNADGGERSRSAASRTPPEACQARAGKRAHGFAVQVEIGSGQRAVAAMSVHSTWREAGAAASASTGSHSDSCDCSRQPWRREARGTAVVDAHVERQRRSIGAEIARASGRPSPGARTATLPMTTRSTPAASSALDGLGASRTPPPAWMRKPRRRAASARSDRARCPATPSRAPSRSTTCRRRRAGVSVAVEQCGWRQRRSGSRRRSRPGSSRTTLPPRRSMDGISSISRRRQEVAEHAGAGAGRALRVELRAVEIAAADDRRERRRRSRRRRRCRAERQRVAVHEIGVVAVAECRRSSGCCAGSTLTSFQPMCGTGRRRSAANAARVSGQDAEAARVAFLAVPRTAAACRGRCRAPAASARDQRAPARARRRRAMASAAAPTPGRITWLARLWMPRGIRGQLGAPSRAARARTAARRCWRRRCR